MAKKKSTRRQQTVPGSIPADIQQLDDIGEQLADANERKNRATNEWKDLRVKMIDAMENHDRKIYEHNSVRYEIVEGADKLKMKTLKED